MRLRGCVFAIACLICAVGLARAQHDHSPHAPQASATLLPGLGSLHHQIATPSDEAQEFFDQGLKLIYAFNQAEATRSFDRAAELDPRSPMPLWGKALALGPNYNEVQPDREQAAYDAIQKAKALAVSAPEVERAYIDALAQRFSNGAKPDYDKLARSYAAAMRDLSHRYPDDPDAAVLFAESLMDLHAWDLWTSDGKPGENTPEIVSVLEEVLRRWPSHIGANHLYIHAVEAAPDPERGLMSAHRLESLAPGAGHLVHMPSHIYIRTGDYEAAVKSNQNAIAVDDADHRARSTKNMTYVLLYSDHNFHVLAAAAMMNGDFDAAIKAAKELEARASADLPETPMVEMYLPTLPFVLLRFGHWDDVLALPVPDAKLKGLAFFGHYARGCAFAAKGEATRADSERTAMEATYQDIPAGPAFGMLYNDWSTMRDLAAHTLAARIATARGDTRAAIEKWRAAVAVQDQMHYNEPPDWFYPLRESLGAALLASGQAAEAEAVFREDLQKNPRNPRSLFGSWKALEAQKKTVDEQWVRTQFEAAWKGGTEPPRLADF